MITLEVGGNRYEGFTDISVFRSIETISGSFSFSATSNNVTSFPIEAKDACKVWIENTQVVDGYVDKVNVSYDAQSHSISISGRDKTADVVDSTALGIKEFNGYSLLQIIEKVLADSGISGISVIDATGATLEPFADTDPVGSPISQTIFEFIESYARKRQVLLTTDGKGNIVMARSSTSSLPITLQNIKNGEFNNILSANAMYDFSRRFNEYVMQSGVNPAGAYGGADTSLENVASQAGSAFDASIRQGRTLEIVSGTPDSNENLADFATWTKNLAVARSVEYRCTVQGHHVDSSNSILWVPNKLVKITDDFANISAIMLLKSVEYKLSIDRGSITELTFVDKDSYTLQAQIDAATAAANTIGGGL